MMASTPTVPTSFLPHQTAAARRSVSGIADVIAYLGFVASGAIFVFAIGVFLYGQVLQRSQASKDAELAAATQNLDVTVVPTLSRLHDRLAAADILLNNHVALSGFFPVLEAIMPTTIRFSSLHIAFDSQNILQLTGSGVAKDFNSLAVASAAFANDSRFKGALFSGIALNSKDGSVNFSLSAAIDPKVIAFTP